MLAELNPGLDYGAICRLLIEAEQNAPQESAGARVVAGGWR